MDFQVVPIIFTVTASGGMGEQLKFQRQYESPLAHWIRLAEEDGAMKTQAGPWVARKRMAFWEARFTVAIANAGIKWHNKCPKISPAGPGPGPHDSSSALSISPIEPSLGLLVTFVTQKQ